MNFIYKWLMSTKNHSYSYELENLIRTVEVYNLLSSDADKSEKVIILDDTRNEYKVFKNITDAKTSYNIFIGNIHIRMETSAKENVYSIHIKKQSDNWEFSVNEDGTINHSCPVTQTYRVYVYYDVPVLNITRATGDSYIHGTWDKYVYKTINTLIGEVNNNTERNQFISAYKNH